MSETSRNWWSRPLVGRRIERAQLDAFVTDKSTSSPRHRRHMQLGVADGGHVPCLKGLPTGRA